jgi:hypothetical protein
MSVKGAGEPSRERAKIRESVFNRRSHPEFSSADRKRGTTCALIHAEIVAPEKR